MKTKPEVSVIIVNFNTKDLVKKSIESVYKHKPTTTFEVIVVDNASTDGSVDVLIKLREKYETFRFLRNSKNEGFARANNRGIQTAQGKYILLLNTDAFLTKGSLDKLYEYAKKKDVGVVGPKLLNTDGSTQASIFNFPTIKRAIEQYWMKKNFALDKYFIRGNEPKEVEVIVMSAFMITPIALQKVGLLDPRYFMYFEDFDYCRRIKRAKLKVVYLPTAEVVHKHGASGEGLVDDANQWRRLVPSSKIYNGTAKHFLLSIITRTGSMF